MTRGEHVRRVVITTVALLFVASLVLYGMTHVIPGDPVRALFGFRPPPPELLAELRDRYGLDDPFYVQYAKFVRNSLVGDFGYSVRGEAVSGIIRESLPVSLRLIGAALAIQVVFGLAFGVAAAIRRTSAISWLIRSAALVVIAVPVFVVAYLLQAYVGARSSFLPVRGLADGWRSYVLPAIALAAAATAYTVRMTHTELRSTSREPFVMAAKAKGLTERRIVTVHMLKASIVPIITLIAASAAQIIGVLIIVEGVFRIPGLGSVVIEAIRAKDHNVIATVLGLALVFSIVSSAVADLLQSRLDPRVRPTQGTPPL